MVWGSAAAADGQEKGRPVCRGWGCTPRTRGSSRFAVEALKACGSGRSVYGLKVNGASTPEFWPDRRTAFSSDVDALLWHRRIERVELIRLQKNRPQTAKVLLHTSRKTAVRLWTAHQDVEPRCRKRHLHMCSSCGLWTARLFASVAAAGRRQPLCTMPVATLIPSARAGALLLVPKMLRHACGACGRAE